MDKISTEELEELVSLNDEYRELKFRVADLSVQLKRTVEALEYKASELGECQGTVHAKYGDVTIDLSTGEYK
jgi:hypothetical protein